MDLAPLEDEWNERRRIQMASIGFKGELKCVCVCVCHQSTHVCDLVQWRVYNVTEWQLKNH